MYNCTIENNFKLLISINQIYLLFDKLSLKNSMIKCV